MRIIEGKALVEGKGRGRVLRLTEPLSLWGGLDPVSGRIIDQRHPQVGETVTERILVLPFGRGSSSASSILLEAVRNSTAPAAIVVREPDGILALGATVAREMYGCSPPLVVLRDDDYETLRDGLEVQVDSGTLSIGSRRG